MSSPSRRWATPRRSATSSTGLTVIGRPGLRRCLTRIIRSVWACSRLPLSDVEQPSQFPELLAPVQVDDDGDTIDAMGRGALRVRVAAGAHQLDVVTCHLKSKLLSFPRRRFQPRDEGEPLHARLSRATGADR